MARPKVLHRPRNRGNSNFTALHQICHPPVDMGARESPSVVPRGVLLQATRELPEVEEQLVELELRLPAVKARYQAAREAAWRHRKPEIRARQYEPLMRRLRAAGDAMMEVNRELAALLEELEVLRPGQLDFPHACFAPVTSGPGQESEWDHWRRAHAKWLED